MKWYLVGMMFLVLCSGTHMGLAGAVTAIDLKKHVPHFNWRTMPDGEKWIYDGDMPVAAFYAGTDPIGGIGRPLALHNARLIPGGPLFIAPREGCGAIHLSWRKHLIYQPKIDEVRADDSDPRTFKLYVKSHDVQLRSDQPRQSAYKPNNVTEESWLELTYDPGLPSYVYDVRTMMTIHPGREKAMFERDFRGLEFGDILPAGMNANYPPYGDKRYQWYVYKGRDGRLYKLPQNHHVGPEKTNILYAENGFMAMLLEPDYNPVVQLVGESGLRAFSEICAAMYDVHFKFVRDKQMELVDAGKPLEIHWRAYSITEQDGRELLEQAVWDPRLDDPGVRVPLYASDGVNDFEPSDEYMQPTDKWSWQPSDGACSWDWKEGYQSKGSLAISRQAESGSSNWRVARALRELRAFGAGPPFKGRYRVTAMVRTEGVTGRVRLAWQYSVRGKGVGWDAYETRPVRYSEQELTGTNDWTELVLETPPMDSAQFATLSLVQEGAGRSWFDNVSITPLP